jgi:hypothetical protein
MHLLWTITKNNGRVLFINQNRYFDQQAHVSLVDNLMQCQLKPSLKRQPMYCSDLARLEQSNPKGRLNAYETQRVRMWRLANSSVGFPKLSKLVTTQFHSALNKNKKNKNQLHHYGGYQPCAQSKQQQLPLANQGGSRKRLSSGSTQAMHTQAMGTQAMGTPYATAHRARLWLRFYQLSSRLATTTYGTTLNGWFSNSSVSNSVFHCLVLFDRLNKHKRFNSLSQGHKVAQTQSHHLTTWSSSEPMADPDTLYWGDVWSWWFKPQGSPQLLKPTQSVKEAESVKQRNQSQSAALHFTKSRNIHTVTGYNPAYLREFYLYKQPDQTEFTKPHHTILSQITDHVTKAGSFGSAEDQILAKNILLGQVNAVVFSNADHEAQLVQEARCLNIPTIGLCGGFAQTNLKGKCPNKRQWVDYPIIGNPNHHHSVCMLFGNVACVNRTHVYGTVGKAKKAHTR